MDDFKQNSLPKIRHPQRYTGEREKYDMGSNRH
jgi:hypothetical protein